VQAGQQAKILGASIADKVLFTGTTHVPLHAKLVILFFVIVSMATTFFTIRQSQKRGMMPAATPDNPMAASQKYMTYIMPLFALTGLYWQFGLVLYWVTTNVWTMGQQYILGRRYPYTPPAADGSTAASPAGASARSLTGGSAGTSGAASAGKATSAAKATGRRGGQPPTGPQRAAANGSAANGSGASASPASMLRRLGRGRAEPEPQDELPDVKLVRRQTQHQSRSKRTGKR
jgi:YidC/Oxa1 family membrane protein insertase